MKLVMKVVISTYQVIFRPLLPHSCRFYPSCSDYALQALSVHDFWPGMTLSLRRVLRCHPWNDGGFDPVKSIYG
ncbi:MAG: membrane protein insertion efficiency factor YidD [Elusimicrobia bacterium]|nr:membrane protein insertion efficiency factor YidD [Elusimicrobiota bacterium]